MISESDLCCESTKMESCDRECCRGAGGVTLHRMVRDDTVKRRMSKKICQKVFQAEETANLECLSSRRKKPAGVECGW